MWFQIKQPQFSFQTQSISNKSKNILWTCSNLNRVPRAKNKFIGEYVPQKAETVVDVIWNTNYSVIDNRVTSESIYKKKKFSHLFYWSLRFAWPLLTEQVSETHVGSGSCRRHKRAQRWLGETPLPLVWTRPAASPWRSAERAPRTQSTGVCAALNYSWWLHCRPCDLERDREIIL